MSEKRSFLVQGTKEFISEVDLLSHLHHKHLVKLVGYHASARGRLLIYDLIPNGSVESHLHGKRFIQLCLEIKALGSVSCVCRLWKCSASNVSFVETR